MSTVLQQARRYEDLLGAEGSDEAYAFETIFDATTWRARRHSKRKFKLLRAIDEKLRAMLFEGERVRYVTQGSSVTFWESYFLGWLMYYLNRRAIVLTDRRIIMLRDTDGVHELDADADLLLEKSGAGPHVIVKRRIVKADGDAAAAAAD